MITQGGWINVDINGNVIGQPRIGSGGPLIDIAPASRDIRPNQRRSVATSALDEAKKQGNKALDAGKKALSDGIDAALKSNPVTAPLAMAADVAGINPFGGGKSWIEQLQDWIKESGIFQRLALAILAFVFIAVALSMFGRQNLVGNIAAIAKGK